MTTAWGWTLALTAVQGFQEELRRLGRLRDVMVVDELLETLATVEADVLAMAQPYVAQTGAEPQEKDFQ